MDPVVVGRQDVSTRLAVSRKRALAATGEVGCEPSAANESDASSAVGPIRLAELKFETTLRATRLALAAPTPQSTERSESIHRTLHAQAATIQDVRVDHGGGHIRMPEQLLHGANIVTGLEQVGRE